MSSRNAALRGLAVLWLASGLASAGTILFDGSPSAGGLSAAASLPVGKTASDLPAAAMAYSAPVVQENVYVPSNQPAPAPAPAQQLVSQAAPSTVQIANPFALLESQLWWLGATGNTTVVRSSQPDTGVRSEVAMPAPPSIFGSVSLEAQGSRLMEIQYLQPTQVMYGNQYQFMNYSVPTLQNPEPGSVFLVVLGLAGVAWRVRKLAHGRGSAEAGPRA